MAELLTRKHTDLMLNALIKSGMIGMPVRKINGVLVDGWMSVRSRSVRSSTHGAFESRIVVIVIRADYQERNLWRWERGYGTNVEAVDMMKEDFHKEMNKLGNLEFNKLCGKLVEKRSNSNKITDGVLREMLEGLFVGEQFTLHSQECCVCYDKTKDTLRCGHYLCLVCESSMKYGELKCPLCRQDYHRCGTCKNDAECDCYDDEEDD